MTEGEIIEVDTLNVYQETGIDRDWAEDLPGYVGLHFEDIIVSKGDEKLEFDEGKKSPYILEYPAHYGESLYQLYFNSREALHNAAKLFKESYCSIDGKIVEDEGEDINKMSREEFEKWERKRDDHWRDGIAKIKLEKDTQRRAWIEKHGSKKLKRILEEGRNYEKQYLVEKGAHLFGKEYVIDYNSEVGFDYYARITVSVQT